LVPVGTQLIDAGGQRFQVTSGGVYANGALIPIAGIDAGAITNHVLGDVLQWVSPPPFAAAKVLVAIGGLTGGIDADSQQVLRARLLDRLKHPPTGGNWAQVTQWAEASNAAVQKCFVYPALDGPATQGVCLLGYLSFDPVLKFSRGIPASVTQQIASYVVAQAPQHANTTFTSPTSRPLPNPNLQTDVSISMTLPASLTASPPGPGGGWVDATPWPKLYGGNLYAAVFIVTSPTQFQIVGFLGAAGTTPKFSELLPGVTRIAWFNKASYAAGGPAMVVSTVISATGSDGNVVVTIDPQAPFNGIAPGDMICPASERVEVYAQTMLASFQSLGPGQWTTDTNRLPRASRYPLTSQAWPSDLTAAQLKDMSNAGSEVLDVAYLYRTQSSPGVPADTTKCPNVLVPGNFGIYPM